MPKLKSIRVVLAVDSVLDRDALREKLQRSDGVEVVAEVSSPVEVLQRTELDQADAVILESQDETEMPGVLTHLFAEFPRILAIAIVRSRNRTIVYRQDIREQVYEGLAIQDLLAELRSADTEYWMRV